MFMFQKTDCSIGHGTVNIVLVLAMCQAKIHSPSLYVTINIRRNNCFSFVLTASSSNHISFGGFGKPKLTNRRVWLPQANRRSATVDITLYKVTFAYIIRV